MVGVIACSVLAQSRVRSLEVVLLEPAKAVVGVPVVKLVLRCKHAQVVEVDRQRQKGMFNVCQRRLNLRWNEPGQNRKHLVAVSDRMIGVGAKEGRRTDCAKKVRHRRAQNIDRNAQRGPCCSDSFLEWRETHA